MAVFSLALALLIVQFLQQSMRVTWTLPATSKLQRSLADAATARIHAKPPVNLIAKTKEELLASLLRAGKLDPDCTSAAQALHNLQLSVDSDFDDGVRFIKRGIRDPRVADDIVGRFQTESLTNYDKESRRTDPVFNHLPPDIVDLLSSGWHMQPHSFNNSILHWRGSFPAATQAVGTMIQVKQKTLQQDARGKTA